MRLRLAALFAATFLFSAPAFAVMEDYPSVKLQGLDKSVGRTVTFEAKVGTTIQYGPLYIKIHACRKAPPIEAPESAAFLQIWEVPPGAEKSEWVFSGWMFASSPALSAMDHPVYDVWVLDCTGREEPNEAAAAAETEKEADQTNLPSAEGEGAIPEGAAPSIQSTTPEEQSVPVDGEAEMGEDDPTAPTPGATADPDAPYVPPAETAPAPAAETPADPNAAVDTPVMPDPNRTYDPATEGVYSPSQGRIIYPDAPPPTNQYPDYDPSQVPQVSPQY